MPIRQFYIWQILESSLEVRRYVLYSIRLYICLLYTSIHVELEKELAEFVGKDEALCFSTGFTVNEGIIPAVVGLSLIHISSSKNPFFDRKPKEDK